MDGEFEENMEEDFDEEELDDDVFDFDDED